MLVNAGGSAIGRIFAQLAKIIGLRMIAFTRSNHHTAVPFEVTEQSTRLLDIANPIQ
ncbi:hypothetical protein HUB98_12870 [Paenibacillus barcinonensis]|uniref:Uncharacterized protein n=1 Tax=Paenibacillus barcinonensis TaxID=198119 RepID=A0ABX6Q6G0_PAEBA|nr:hypothetical protein [Paenibacillus barcinonensis]QKS57120.1 hypothetical protein HUB98_12870 [Paenibacillus barcinonensis]